MAASAAKIASLRLGQTQPSWTAPLLPPRLAKAHSRGTCTGVETTMISATATPSAARSGNCATFTPYHDVSTASAAAWPASKATTARAKAAIRPQGFGFVSFIQMSFPGKREPSTPQRNDRLRRTGPRVLLTFARDDRITYGIRIEEPVVSRPSRSSCALRASLSGYVWLIGIFTAPEPTF